MKKFKLVILLGLGVIGNLTAMESTYAEATADRPVISSEESVAQGTMIKVETSDAQEFEIPLELAKKMPTISNLLEDVENAQDIAIPLPAITAATFDYVIKLLSDVPVDLKELSIVRLRRIVRALAYLGIRTAQAPIQELISRVGSTIEEFNQVFFKLDRESQILLWRQHPAYKYFFQPHLIKKLEFIPVESVNISSDNHRLGIVSYKYGTAVKIFDMNELDQDLYTFPHKNLGIITLNSDLSKLISFKLQKLHMYDVQHPDRKPYLFENELMSSVRFSPDGKRLFSWSSSEKTIKIWNLDNLDQAPRELDNVDVDFLIVSSDSKKMIAWHNDTITIWNMDNLDQLPQTLNYEKLSFVDSAGNLLVAWSEAYGTIKIWNLDNLYTAPKELYHEQVDRVTPSFDGYKLVSSSREGIIKIWNMKNSDPLVGELDDMVINGFKITQDRLILSSSMRNKIQVWDFYNLDQDPDLLQTEHRQTLGDVIVSEDGSTLVMWTSGSINIWDLIGHNELDNLNPDQMKLMIWLYDNKNQAVKFEFKLPAEQQTIYQTLSDRLQRSLQKIFPKIATQPSQEKVSLKKSKRKKRN